MKPAAARRSLVRRLVDAFFGFDFFISYARADGVAYAEELERRLAERGFESFLDTQDYATGDNWRFVGRAALRKTGSMILIGSPRALESEPVMAELKAFQRTSRRILPISFGGSLDFSGGDHPVGAIVTPDILRIEERPDSLTAGPSDDVFERILNSFDLVRQHDKRIRGLSIAVVVFAVVALVAIVAAGVARHQTKVAEERTREAQRSLARTDFENASSAIQRGDLRLGVHWLTRVSQDAPEGDPLQRSAERMIEYWSSELAWPLLQSGSLGAAAFTTNPRLVATFGADGAYLWDTESGSRTEEFVLPEEVRPGRVIAAAFPLPATADGDFGQLYALGLGTEVLLCDGGERTVLSRHDLGATIRSIAFSPRTRTLAVACESHLLTWDAVETWIRGTPERIDMRQVGAPWSLAFGADDVLAVGTLSELAVLDRSNTGITERFRSPAGRYVAVDPDGGLLAAATYDGATRILDLETGDVIRELAAGDPEAARSGRRKTFGVQFLRGGTELASIGDPMERWRIADGQSLSRAYRFPITDEGFRRTTRAIPGPADGRVLIDDRPTESPMSTKSFYWLFEHRVPRDLGEPISAGAGGYLELSPGAERVLVQRAGEFRVEEVDSGTVVQALDVTPPTTPGSSEPTETVHFLDPSRTAFSADGAWFAALVRREPNRAWCARWRLGESERPEWRELEGLDPRGIAVSVDGHVLISGAESETGKAVLWRLGIAASDDLAGCERFASVVGPAFSEDGQRVLVVGIDLGIPTLTDDDSTQILVWDVASGKLRATWRQAEGTAGARFLPDGSAVVGVARRPSVYDLATKQSVALASDESGALGCVSPDGSTVAIAYRDFPRKRMGIRFFSTSTGCEGAPEIGVHGQLRSMEFRADGRGLVVLSDPDERIGSFLPASVVREWPMTGRVRGGESTRFVELATRIRLAANGLPTLMSEDEMYVRLKALSDEAEAATTDAGR